ncbi:MAG: FtsX-like permease family protein [Flavobacteriales bacterium]|jgi:ABC-type lipoprotein release transport system permease subunit
MLKLAWRNIWRNKGRSIITIAATMFCVIFAVVLRSFQVGVWEHMVDDIVANNFGYLQIHQKGFWGEQSLDLSMDEAALPMDQWAEVDGVRSVVRRLESFSLVSTEQSNRGSLVLGIEPENELPGLQLQDQIVEGQVFAPGSDQVVVSEGLAEFLKVNVGDSLMFLSQGYRGASAYGQFMVSGIAKISNPELNKQLVLMPLQTAQWMYNGMGLLTTAVVDLEPGADHKEVKAELLPLMSEELELLEWGELFPELIQTIEADMAGGQIFVTILYFIISFVLLGTVIMMVSERQREFGILVSIGMRKTTLAFVTVMENLMLTLGGAIVGMALVKPVQFYFKYNPIDLSGQMKEAIEQFDFEPKLYTTTSFIINLNHGAIVFVIGVLVSLYAVWKIMKLEPVKSMRT